jgi:hypothetical protein
MRRHFGRKEGRKEEDEEGRVGRGGERLFERVGGRRRD